MMVKRIFVGKRDARVSLNGEHLRQECGVSLAHDCMPPGSARQGIRRRVGVGLQDDHRVSNCATVSVEHQHGQPSSSAHCPLQCCRQENNAGQKVWSVMSLAHDP